MSIYFDSDSEQFALNFNELTFWSSHFGQLLLDNIPIREKVRVLDVGCATGFPLLELSDRLGKNSSMVGIDPWEAAVKYLNSKIVFRETPNTEVVLADALEIPFKDSHFDLIVSNLGLNNFDQKELVVRECKRVLSQDGRIAISTNYKGHMEEFYSAFKESLKKLNLNEYVEKVEQDESRRSTIPEIQRLFTSEGFASTQMVEKKIFLRYASGTAFLESSFVESCFMSTWKSLLPESKWTEVKATIEDKLNSIAKSEGELRISIPMAYLEFMKQR